MRIALMCLWFFTNELITYGQDYSIYHQNIIKAEQLIFKEQNYKEGLDVYLETFNAYDFVFAQDCIIAMQIALYKNNKTAFLFLVKKGIQNGLMPKHFLKMSYFKNHPFYEKHKDSISRLYRINRPHYLKRIDTNLLKTMIELYAKDQLGKLQTEQETIPAYKKRYKKEVTLTFETFRQLCFTIGYPSDKLIGMDQNNIMKELKSNSDLIDFYFSARNSAIYHIQTEDQFILEENDFACTLPYPILHHYGHMNFYSSFFSDTFYLDQIKKGNIHPKDMAALVDIPFSNLSGSIPNPSKGERFFGVGVRMGPGYDGIPLLIPDTEINKFRAKFFIAPIENDRLKWKFMKENGMVFGFGSQGTRS